MTQKTYKIDSRFLNHLSDTQTNIPQQILSLTDIIQCQEKELCQLKENLRQQQKEINQLTENLQTLNEQIELIKNTHSTRIQLNSSSLKEQYTKIMNIMSVLDGYVEQSSKTKQTVLDLLTLYKTLENSLQKTLQENDDIKEDILSYKKLTNQRIEKLANLFVSI